MMAIMGGCALSPHYSGMASHLRRWGHLYPQEVLLLQQETAARKTGLDLWTMQVCELLQQGLSKSGLDVT
jgi:hypothetical protein